MNLAELLKAQKGDRSYDQLEKDCGGRPTSKRLQQIVTGQLRAFPDPDSIRNLAKGLRVSESSVVLAAAESLGLDVRRALPRIVELLPADAGDLSDQQASALAEIIRAFRHGIGASAPAASGPTAIVPGPSPEPDENVTDVEALHGADEEPQVPLAARRGESAGRAARREQDEAGERTDPGTQT